MTETYDRAELEAELIHDEGERLRVYLDTAKPPKRTIAVGRNLDARGILLSETARFGITLESVLRCGVTREQSRFMLGNDIDDAERDLDRELTWWRSLDAVRQRVLLNMCFNMGIGRRPAPAVKGKGLLQFVNTLAAIERHDWPAAVAGMKASKWHRQVGARAVRLEAMMETGRAP